MENPLAVTTRSGRKPRLRPNPSPSGRDPLALYKIRACQHFNARLVTLLHLLSLESETSTMSVSEIGAKTSAETVCSLFASQIKGRTILLTGPTVSGIGFATALPLARHQPELLILAGRSISR
jgi:FlaA1/EpsC-like NDP-sugar epimerase